MVRKLLDREALGPGHHERIWDGRRVDGRISAAGVYFYRFEAGDLAMTRRLLLLK